MYLSSLSEWVTEATVDVTELMGANIHLYLNVEEAASLIATVSSRSQAKSGDTIKIALDISRLHIFDKDTEKCIVH